LNISPNLDKYCGFMSPAIAAKPSPKKAKTRIPKSILSSNITP